jgi:phosphomannomutase
MDRIKFGTDGWRAIIAKDFTILNVSKVAYATAQWLTKKYKNPSAVVGYDSRFGGDMFVEAAAKTLASKGIRVYLPEHFVSTPTVSLGIMKLKANCGIVITASHKGPEYNGFKIRGETGGALPEKVIRDIEYMINDSYEIDLDLLNWNYMIEQGLIQYIDLETVYIKQITDSFDIEKMASSAGRLAFDAMYGSSQNVIKRLFPDSKLFHCEFNPTFMGVPPDPIHKNLHELSEFIWNNKEIDCGIAVDGDGDRLALYDHEGNLIDSHHVILLLIHYLAGYKKLTGKVVASFALTTKIEILCKHYGLDVERVKVGFSDITSMMVSGNVLLGGEESGGIAIGSHIPERDGIWSGLMIWQWMIESGKNLKQLIEEVYEITEPFTCERQDIELNKNIRNKVIGKCSDGSFTSFGEYVVQKMEHLDGYKFYFSDNQWLLIRLSGTEPLLRLYVQAENKDAVSSIMDAATVMIQNL